MFPRSRPRQFVHEWAHSLSQESEINCETTSSQDKAPKSSSLIISILSITLERPHHKTDDQSVRLQGMTRGDKGRSIVQYVTQPIGEFAFEL